MKKDKTNTINNSVPIEKQDTAAWANFKSLQPETRVIIPSEEAIDDARDWVNHNEK